MLPDAAAVGSLRDEFDEVHTWGSGELLRGLLAEGLLDRLNLWMYPIALGTGKRLFDTGIVPVTFRPAKAAQVFDSGVLALVLEPAGDVKTGEVGAAAGVANSSLAGRANIRVQNGLIGRSMGPCSCPR